MPVARDVLRHAATAPDRCALLPDDGPSLSYGELAHRTSALAALLHGASLPSGAVRAGDVVAVDLGATHRRVSVADELVALLAVDLVGGVPLLCDGAWTGQQRRAILDATGPRHRVVTVPPDLPVPAGFVPHPAHGTDLAWAGFTSGSTGRPRAVVRTRSSWTGSFPAVTELSRGAALHTVLVPGPLATSLYCFGAVHALALGATVRHTTSRASFVSAARACDVVHLVPADLALLVDTVEPSARNGAERDATSHRVRTAMVGGAALPPGVRRRAGHLGIRVVAYYGATELSFVAVDDDGTGLRPFPEVEIAVRSSVREPLTERDEGGLSLGQVWVRSPWLASGYLAGADGPLRQDDGWATVGDLAEPGAADGRLVLRGRGTGTITTGAATVVCEDVEAALRDCPGVDDVVVLAEAHPTLGEVVAAVVVGSARLTALESHARERLAPAQRPRRWYTADELPRTATGKPARSELVRLVARANAPELSADGTHAVRRVPG